MKQIEKSFILIFSITLIFSNFLQAAETKVGIVNVQEVLETVDEGKAAKAQFEKFLSDRRKQLQDKEKEIKRLEESYDKQKLILSSSALEEKRKELEAKKGEFQKNYMMAQTDSQKKEMELTSEIIKKVRAVVEKIGQQEGYQLVLERSEGGVLFYKDSFDTTKKVIDEYNKAYKKK